MRKFASPVAKLPYRFLQYRPLVETLESRLQPGDTVLASLFGIGMLGSQISLVEPAASTTPADASSSYAWDAAAPFDLALTPAPHQQSATPSSSTSSETLTPIVGGDPFAAPSAGRVLTNASSTSTPSSFTGFGLQTAAPLSGGALQGSDSVMLSALATQGRPTGQVVGIAQTTTPAAPQAPRQEVSLDEARDVLADQGLRFEANAGQTDEAVDFFVRGSNYRLFLTPTEAVFDLISNFQPAHTSRQGTEIDPQAGAASDGLKEGAVVRLQLVGSNPAAQPVGMGQQPGFTNYVLGNNPSNWQQNVAAYSQAGYDEVYPGIDLIYYGNAQGQLEYDFVVAPGADFHQIALNLAGADSVSLDGQGNLVLDTAAGQLVQHAPITYQVVHGVRQEITSAFAVNGQQVRFELGAYDASMPLVIDPTLSYSTYLGGSLPAPPGSSADILNAVATLPILPPIFPSTPDYAAVTGTTLATDFPTSAGAYSTTCSGTPCQDGFYSVIDMSMSGPAALLYSTYFGGTGADNGNDIAFDLFFNIHVAGETISSDFPVVNGAQPTFGGGFCGARSCFDGTLTVFPFLSPPSYSTYQGSAAEDSVRSVAATYDPGFAPLSVIAAFGDSTHPVSGTSPPYGGGTIDTIIGMYNPALSGAPSRLFTHFYGGSDIDLPTRVDGDLFGNGYLTGVTRSANLPTVSAIQPAFGGGVCGTVACRDGFAAHFSSTGSLTWSTYLGGPLEEVGRDISVDPIGLAVNIAGFVNSDTGFPVTATAFQSTRGTGMCGTPPVNCFDGFLSTILNIGSPPTLYYSTYLGAPSVVDAAYGVATYLSIDDPVTVAAYVTGETRGAGFPTVSPIQPALGGPQDAFLARFDLLGAGPTSLTYSTYFGGTVGDLSNGVAVYRDGAATPAVHAVMAGITNSVDLPLATGVLPIHAYRGAPQDAWLARVSD